MKAARAAIPPRKPQASRASRTARRALLVVVPVLVALAAGTVWLRLSIVRTSYAINQVEQKIRAARQAREELVLKQSALRSPRRLESLARGQFGLGTPRADQVIHMGDRSRSGEETLQTTAAHPAAEAPR